MNRDVVDNACEQGILGLVLAILVIGPLAMGATGPIAFLVLQTLTLATMALWLVRLWTKREFRLLWPPLSWAVVAFALYAVFRYRDADLEYLARLELVRVLMYAFLFLVIVNNLHRQEHLQLIVFTLIYLAMAISAYAIYQFVTGSNKVWGYTTPYEHRGSGTYISPNHCAGFLEMLLPLGLAHLLASRARAVSKVMVGYASLVILAGIAATLSKGGWVATLGSLGLFFAVLSLHRTHRLPALALLVVLVGIGYYFIPRTQMFRERAQQYVSPSGEVNDDMRFPLWQAGVKIWETDPWWGVGPGLFNSRFPAFRPTAVQLQPDRVHNDYLNTLVDWGIVGAAIVTLAFVLLFWGVAKTWPFVRGTSSDLGKKRSNKFALVLGASIGLVAILLHSVADFNLQIPANAILMVTLMAILTSCRRFATEQFWVTAQTWMKFAMSLALLAGLVFLAGQGFRRARETYWLDRARADKPLSNERLNALKQAFRAEPRNSQTAFDIGDLYREWAQAPNEGQDVGESATNGMRWLAQSMTLNPYDARSCLDYGVCLDLVDRQADADAYFDKAWQRDPNSYYVNAYIGWHYVQKGDFAAARPWFDRSLTLEWRDNAIPSNYLAIVQERMLENASPNPFGLQLKSP